MDEYLPIRVGTNFHTPSIFILVYKIQNAGYRLKFGFTAYENAPKYSICMENAKFSGDEDAPPHTSAPRRLRYFAPPPK